MIPTPNIGEIIGYANTFGQPLWNALWPWAKYIGAISVSFVIVEGLISWIDDKLYWNNQFKELETDLSLYQELFGKEQGGINFLRAQAFLGLDKKNQQFISRFPSILTRNFEQYEEKKPLFVQGTGFLERLNGRQEKNTSIESALKRIEAQLKAQRLKD